MLVVYVEEDKRAKYYLSELPGREWEGHPDLKTCAFCTDYLGCTAHLLGYQPLRHSSAFRAAPGLKPKQKSITVDRLRVKELKRSSVPQTVNQNRATVYVYTYKKVEGFGRGGKALREWKEE